jgi:hypothetical protein
MAFQLNYEEWLHLDAESLAEEGIKEAYEELLPHLRKYISNPAAKEEIEEIADHDAPSYAVRFRGRTYVIHSPNLGGDEGESWYLATYVLFHIVNDQLRGSPYRFYAINGGNDLGGMFLRPDDAEAARPSLPQKSDWPYLPELERPWYGRHR